MPRPTESPNLGFATPNRSPKAELSPNRAELSRQSNPKERVRIPGIRLPENTSANMDGAGGGETPQGKSMPSTVTPLSVCFFGQVFFLRMWPPTGLCFLSALAKDTPLAISKNQLAFSVREKDEEALANFFYQRGYRGAKLRPGVKSRARIGVLPRIQPAIQRSLPGLETFRAPLPVCKIFASYFLIWSIFAYRFWVAHQIFASRFLGCKIFVL